MFGVASLNDDNALVVNILFAMLNASSPDILIMPIAPEPIGVDIVAIVFMLKIIP